MKKLLFILGVLFFSTPIFAQTPVQTQPKGVISYNSSGTISSTNVFQSVFLANSNRVSCTIQNNGANAMWVYFGPLASATKGASVELAIGQSAFCNNNVIVLQDQVSITGTSTDAFFAAQQ